MDVTAIVGLLAALSGVVIGWLGRKTAYKHEVQTEATTDATLQADVRYIMRGVEDIRIDIRDQGRRFDALAERVTRVEESSKQAHKRLDRYDKEVDHG